MSDRENYEIKAVECERAAVLVTDINVRKVYLDLARQWRQMARDVEERDGRRGSASPEAQEGFCGELLESLWKSYRALDLQEVSACLTFLPQCTLGLHASEFGLTPDPPRAFPNFSTTRQSCLSILAT